MPHQVAFLLDRADVLIVEADVASGALAAGLLAGAARPEDDDVGAHGVEHVAIAEP